MFTSFVVSLHGTNQKVKLASLMTLAIKRVDFANTWHLAGKILRILLGR